MPRSLREPDSRGQLRSDHQASDARTTGSQPIDRLPAYRQADPRPMDRLSGSSPSPDFQRRSGRRPPSLGRCLADLCVVGLAFLVAFVGLTAYTTFRISQVGQQDGRRHVDAIVVMGAAQYNGRPSGALAARLDHAIALYQDGYADYLFTTGGNLPGDITTEAETGRRYAMNRGVPESAILMENTGGSTLESLQNVKTVFDERGLHTALFVSDRSHMLRVLRMAQDLGIEAWASPTATSPDDLDPNLANKSLLHELGAMAQYLFLHSEEVPSDASQVPASPIPAAGPGEASPAP